jgi:hypothetical protein
MRRCAAGPRWAARGGVLGRDRIAPNTNAPCVLAPHHPSHPDDEAPSRYQFRAHAKIRTVAPWDQRAWKPGANHIGSRTQPWLAGYVGTDG